MTTPDTPSPIADDDELRLLDASDLGKLLGRGTKSIKVDVSRRPHTLPPVFKVPGTRLLKWRRADVRAWLEAIADLERQKRIAGHAITSFHLGKKSIGAAATAHLNARKG